MRDRVEDDVHVEQEVEDQQEVAVPRRVLRDYKQLLRIRSLLARGRATIKSKHHPVIARLFGGTVASRGSPKRSRPLGRFGEPRDCLLYTSPSPRDA